MRRIRVHANFGEYVPFILILMGLAESVKSPHLVLHIMGIALVFARLSHAYGVSQPNETFKFRVFCMVTTFGILTVGSIACLVGAITN